MFTLVGLGEINVDGSEPFAFAFSVCLGALTAMLIDWFALSYRSVSESSATARQGLQMQVRWVC